MGVARWPSRRTRGPIIGELRRVYLLNALSDDELALLASAIKSRQFGKGEVLMHEGDEGDRFYILRKGKVEVFAQGKGGEPPKHIRDLDGVSDGELYR